MLYNAQLCVHKCNCLLKTPPVGTYKWRLLYEQIMDDNIVKHSSNNITYVNCVYSLLFCPQMAKI